MVQARGLGAAGGSVAVSSEKSGCARGIGAGGSFDGPVVGGLGEGGSLIWERRCDVLGLLIWILYHNVNYRVI